MRQFCSVGHVGVGVCVHKSIWAQSVSCYNSHSQSKQFLSHNYYYLLATGLKRFGLSSIVTADTTLTLVPLLVVYSTPGARGLVGLVGALSPVCSDAITADGEGHSGVPVVVFSAEPEL